MFTTFDTWYGVLTLPGKTRSRRPTPASDRNRLSGSVPHRGGQRVRVATIQPIKASVQRRSYKNRRVAAPWCASLECSPHAIEHHALAFLRLQSGAHRAAGPSTRDSRPASPASRDTTGMCATLARDMRSITASRYSSGYATTGSLPASNSRRSCRRPFPARRQRSTAGGSTMPSTSLVAVDHRKAGMIRVGIGQEGGQLVQRHAVRHGLHVGHHDLPHPGQDERIDPVFARQMMAAARHLLGQDRAPHQQHRDQVGGGAGGDQRQQAHACCRSAPPRRTSRSAASAWCRPWSRTCPAAPRSRGWRPAGYAPSPRPGRRP